MTTHKLIVVRGDGLVQETSISGWNSEGVSDRLANEAKADPRTIFLCTIVSDGDSSYTRQWFHDEKRCEA
jgi:hypothetical protein